MNDSQDKKDKLKKSIDKKSTSEPHQQNSDQGGKLHIVYQQADVNILQKAIELEHALAGEIKEIKDDFAVGPLKDIDTEEGWVARENWWKELITGSPYPVTHVGSFDDRKMVEEIKAWLKENKDGHVWIWVGQNQHDVCGYYWLISQLKNYQQQLRILFLSNLPFINEKGQIFYPSAIHQIQPKELVKARKICRQVTLSEIEVDPDEWKRLSTENAVVRILEGGKKIVSKPDTFYDNDILAGLTAEWQKGNKAIHNILAQMKIKTGDVFLLWRIKHLASEDKIQINGSPAQGWKDFELKLNDTSTINVIN